VHKFQKNSEVYNTSGIPENQWSLASFKKYLSEELNQPEAWDTIIRPQLKKLVITAVQSWPKESHRRYSFELLGFDIMLDEDLKPYLIEINTNPGLHMLTDIVRPHHTKAQLDLLKVVLDNRKDWEEGIEVTRAEEKFGAWELIYSEIQKKQS